MKTKTVAPLQSYAVEVTDTFGGEANYSWVRRTIVKALNMASAIRQAKAWAGLTGCRCRKEDFGDSVSLFPSGICQVLFVNWTEAEEAPVPQENPAQEQQAGENEAPAPFNPGDRVRLKESARMEGEDDTAFTVTRDEHPERVIVTPDGFGDWSLPPTEIHKREDLEPVPDELPAIRKAVDILQAAFDDAGEVLSLEDCAEEIHRAARAPGIHLSPEGLAKARGFVRVMSRDIGTPQDVRALFDALASVGLTHNPDNDPGESTMEDNGVVTFMFPNELAARLRVRLKECVKALGSHDAVMAVAYDAYAAAGLMDSATGPVSPPPAPCPYTTFVSGGYTAIKNTETGASVQWLGTSKEALETHKAECVRKIEQMQKYIAGIDAVLSCKAKSDPAALR